MSKIKFEIFEEAFNKSKISKADLARIVGVKPNALQGWFERKSVPSNYLYPVADALGVNPRYLLGETNDETRMQLIPIIGKSTTVVPSMPLLNSGYKTIERHYFGKNVYGIISDTDSMTPDIKNKALCLCDPNIIPEVDDIVHYSWGDRHGIAKYKISADNTTIVLAPTNIDYSPIFIPWDSEDKLHMVKIFRVEQDL